MLKLKVAATALAIALAGTASAGWRTMRVEAADLSSFEESVAAFEGELSTARHYVFMLALQDIWAQGLQRAGAEQREYTEAEYFRQLDGLTYDDIVAAGGPVRRNHQRPLPDRRCEDDRQPRNRSCARRERIGLEQRRPVGGPGGQYRGGRG